MPSELRPSVLAICGSLRRDSYNRKLLESARARCAELDIEIFDLGEVPLFNEDVEAAGIPRGVEELWSEVQEAEALLIATPEYNQSIPGVLKNAIDWLSRSEPPVLASKAVAIMGVTVGAWGTRHAQAGIRHSLAACGACVMPAPQVYFRGAADLFGADGRLSDEGALASLESLLSGFRSWVDRIGRND